MAAAAVLLLDVYAVTLEQHLLSEAFFGLALLGAAYLAIASRGAPGLAASGLLLGLAVTLRTAGLFAVPVWLVYLAWSRRGLRPAAAGLAVLLVVLCGYAGLHARGDPSRQANPDTFSLTEMDGWFLYAKTAAIADCRGADIPERARPLCQPADERSRDADFYLFNPDSPAKQLVGRHRSGEQQIEDNRMLREFALAIIREHPWAYAKMVARDSAGDLHAGRQRRRRDRPAARWGCRSSRAAAAHRSRARSATPWTWSRSTPAYGTGTSPATSRGPLAGRPPRRLPGLVPHPPLADGRARPGRGPVDAPVTDPAAAQAAPPPRDVPPRRHGDSGGRGERRRGQPDGPLPRPDGAAARLRRHRRAARPGAAGPAQPPPGSIAGPRSSSRAADARLDRAGRRTPGFPRDARRPAWRRAVVPPP